MSDLTDRLLAVEGSREGTHWYRNPDGPEAAAEIERLQARVAVLTEVLLSAANVCDRWAEESRRGAWSTHQVSANLKLADMLRRAALSEPPTGETPAP